MSREREPMYDPTAMQDARRKADQDLARRNAAAGLVPVTAESMERVIAQWEQTGEWEEPHART